MKIVDLKCPKCGGPLTGEGEQLVCKYCRGVFTIDYDESDVEYERLQTEDERAERQLARDKELLAERYRLEKETRMELEKNRSRASIGMIAVIFVVLLAVVGGIFFVFKLAKPGSGGSRDEAEELATETPGPDYGVTADSVDSLADFIKSGYAGQMNIKECASLNENGVAVQWDKTDAEFVDAYLVTDIPNMKRERETNRLVLIYKVTWHNDRYGDKTCYDACYFEGLQVNPNGGIISDYAPTTIWRSDAAWGWGMAYSFETYDQCYLENVTALGGNVTKIKEENK